MCSVLQDRGQISVGYTMRMFVDANLAFMVLWTEGSLVHGQSRTPFVSTLGNSMVFFLF